MAARPADVCRGAGYRYTVTLSHFTSAHFYFGSLILLNAGGCCGSCSGQKDETLLLVLKNAMAETIKTFSSRCTCEINENSNGNLNYHEVNNLGLF